MERKNNYRVQLKIVKVGTGTINEVGERWIDISEALTGTLSSLPDDREIMEEMSNNHPLAWMEHQKNMELMEERKNAIKELSNLIRHEVTYIIESQDKVNGYDRSEI